jgi:hypothetical protein
MKWAGHPITLTHRISNGERKKTQRKQLRRWFNEEDIARCLAYTFPKSTPPERAHLPGAFQAFT